MLGVGYEWVDKDGNGKHWMCMRESDGRRLDGLKMGDSMAQIKSWASD